MVRRAHYLAPRNAQAPLADFVSNLHPYMTARLRQVLMRDARLPQFSADFAASENTTFDKTDVGVAQTLQLVRVQAQQRRKARSESAYGGLMSKPKPLEGKMSATTIINRPEVERRTGKSRVWLYRHAKDGTFPKPVQVSIRAIGWIEAEVEAWLNNLPKGRTYSSADEAAPAPLAASGDER
jgi:prophage regulatory protein